MTKEIDLGKMITEQQLIEWYLNKKQVPYHNLEPPANRMLAELGIDIESVTSIKSARYIGPQLNDQFTQGCIYEVTERDYYEFCQVTHGLSATGNDGHSAGFTKRKWWEPVNGTFSCHFGKTERT